MFDGAVNKTDTGSVVPAVVNGPCDRMYTMKLDILMINPCEIIATTDSKFNTDSD